MNGDKSKPSVTFDEWFTVLADRACRYVLYFFEEYDGDSASVAELARYVRARDGDSHSRSNESDRLELLLYHAKLPKLADADVVEFDARSRTVRYRGTPALEEWVCRIAETEREADTPDLGAE